MPAGDGVWRVWRVLEGLERLESFGGFAGWQTAALKAHRKPLLWPGPGVPVGEVALALALGCLLGKLFKGKGLEGLEEDKVHTCGGLGTVFGGFGGFSGLGAFGEVWRVCGLANGSFESP